VALTPSPRGSKLLRVDREQVIIILKGLGVILIIPLIYLIVRFGCLLPGWGGEVFAFIAGWLTSPFLMEGTIALIGFIILLWINGVRREKEAKDDFISREELAARETHTNKDQLS